MSTRSPCIKVCELDGDVCIGCRRTTAEIAGWLYADEKTRRAILAAAAKRPLPSEG